MNEMLHSIKTDLLSRRLLPLLVGALVLLVAALGYALSGGSSSGGSTPSASTSNSSGAGTKSLTVVVAGANPNQAISETPGGVRYQSQSPTRDPFTPLAQPVSAKAKASSSSTGSSSTKPAGSSSSGSSSGGSSSSKGSGGSAPKSTPPPKSSTPAKTKQSQSSYTVTVQFGLVPAAPQQNSGDLSSFANLKPQAPVPSKQDARVVFERVSPSGKGAVFKLVSSPILHGGAQCVPSTAECEAIELTVGQSEELEYSEANGQPALYELKLVAITNGNPNATAARIARRTARRAGRK